MICTLLASIYQIPPAQARTSAPTTITVATVYAERRNSTFTVEIFIENAASMAGGQLVLLYDPEVAVALETNRGEIIQGFMYESNLEKATAGQIAVAWANDTGVSGSGTLLEVTFRLLKQGGETAFTIDELTLWDDQLKIIETTKTAGLVSSFQGATLPTKRNIAPEKEWTVRFNIAIDPTSIDENTIYVISNDTGRRIGTSASVSVNFKAVIIKPLTPYTPRSYTLIITEKIESANGTALKEPVRMTFIVD